MVRNFVLSASLCLVFAACQTTPDDNRNSDRVFGNATGALVMEAQELANSGHYSDAIEKLNTAKVFSTITPYEVSTIESMLGHYTYEINDIAAAIRHNQNAVDAGGLLPEEISALKSNIRQLVLLTENSVN